VSRLFIALLKALRHLPLPWLRGLAWVFGRALCILAAKRRRIALRNVALCFPALSEAQRAQLVREHFVYWSQALFDRAWLWHSPPAVVAARLNILGGLPDQAAMIFAPHFVGLDAGWTALTLHGQDQLTKGQRFANLYTPQRGAADAWTQQGRARFGHPTQLTKEDKPRAIVDCLRRGEHFYILPDLDYGLNGAVFVPFFGVQAATVTTLSRLARLASVPVVGVYARITPTGYDIRITPPWSDFPTKDATADTAAMNGQLEDEIRTMPAQYFWVHQRFKTRPVGQRSLYS
jgi:Kdo2-lipid IVA lauroyltransferase/acyltransferase